MYRERMNDYYPQVIQAISEFQAIIDGEYPEFEALDEGRQQVISDAYLLTMTEDRIEQWENMLGIKPIEGSSVDDRRETVVARIRGQGKLNSDLINTIVGTFTGGTAKSYIKDSVLYVVITPPPNNKQYQFANVEQELSKKVPAHLGFAVSRNYYTWDETKKKFLTWGNVYSAFSNWEDILLFVPFEMQTQKISGVVLSIVDADDARLQGLTIYGKTIQNGTPTPESPVPLESVGESGNIGVQVGNSNLLPFPYHNKDTETSNGLTFNVQPDGSVVVNGTSTAEAFFSFTTTASKKLFLPKGKYTFSGVPSGTYGGSMRPQLWVQNASGTVKFAVYAEGKTVEITNPDYFAVSIDIVKGNTLNNFVVKPMINVGETALPFESPIERQVLTAHTPNGLPGIPVSSGGNYTDESGQQWICDEIDFARGVYVQRVATAENLIFSDNRNTVGTSNLFRAAISNANFSTWKPTLLCSHLSGKNAVYNTDIEGCFVTGGYLYARIPGITNADSFNAKMQGAKVVYEMVAPIETALSAVELAQYRALVTHKNYTTVYNDQNAWMDVTYALPSKRS